MNDLRLDMLRTNCSNEYDKFREVADVANAAYIEALRAGDTHADLKEVLKNDYESASKRADLTLETLHSTKRRLISPNAKALLWQKLT